MDRSTPSKQAFHERISPEHNDDVKGKVEFLADGRRIYCYESPGQGLMYVEDKDELAISQEPSEGRSFKTRARAWR